jgi:6-phospho-3-hexuloisomerase
LYEINHNVLKNIDNILKKINEDEVKTLLNLISQTNRIFIFGAGRSLLVGRSFGMRLMQIGFSVYIVGDTTTPAIKPDDLLITISRSGTTKSVNNVAETAKKIGSKILVISSNSKSYLNNLADYFLIINTENINYKQEHDYESNKLKGKYENLGPLGTIFELSCNILLNSFIIKLMEFKHKSEKDLQELHANLE